MVDFTLELLLLYGNSGEVEIFSWPFEIQLVL